MSDQDDIIKRANLIYNVNDQCIDFVSKFYGINKESLFPCLFHSANSDKFEKVIDCSSYNNVINKIQIGDLVAFVPPISKIYKFHVAIYMGNDTFLSKMGDYEGLYDLHISEYIEIYEPLTFIVIRDKHNIT